MAVKPAALLLSVAIVTCPGAAEAQSASRIIDRYIDAIGGKRAVERIASTEVSGTVSNTDGRAGVFTQRTKRPHLYFVSMSWDAAEWSVGFNGRAAWQRDRQDGVRTLYGEAASHVRAEAGYASHRFLAPARVNQISVVGPDEVRGRPVTAIRAITTDGTARTLFFDTESHLLVKDAQETDAGLEERFYDDYRRAGQVLEPHRIEWHRGGETFRIVVDRIEHNAPIDEQAFDVPLAPAEPPLDADAILSAAARNERSGRPLRNAYMYTEASTSRRLDAQGEVERESSRSYEVFHLDGLRVARLLEEDGEPLSEADRRREDERVSAVVREYQRQRQSGQPARSRPAARGVSGTIVGIPLLSLDRLPAYLRMSDLSHIRRERVGDRVAIVIEFQPRRGARASDDFDRQAGRMAGTLWIDEASQHAMRMESYFVDDFDRTIQGTSLRVEQTLFNDDVWLPSRYEINSRLGFAFGRHAHWLSTVRFADHRKFVVEASFEVVPSGAPR